MFSIIIPSWNNLPYLKLCIASIRKNSKFNHQIIVHINEGSDGSLAWIKSENLDHTYSPANIGICYALNQAAELSKNPYIVFLNDDMYCCPEWDSELVKAIEKLDSKDFMLSGTLIEPKGRNPCVLVRDYGRDLESFNESLLLSELSQLKKQDWNGSSWPPTVIHRDWWFKVGGYSIEFSPGMGSDNDFSMKMWFAGCRVFRGIGTSFVYHFQTKTTNRIKKNNASLQFIRKWGISISTFSRFYLKAGTNASSWTLAEPRLSLKFRVKKFFCQFKLWTGKQYNVPKIPEALEATVAK